MWSAAHLLAVLAASVRRLTIVDVAQTDKKKGGGGKEETQKATENDFRFGLQRKTQKMIFLYYSSSYPPGAHVPAVECSTPVGCSACVGSAIGCR